MAEEKIDKEEARKCLAVGCFGFSTDDTLAGRASAFYDDLSNALEKIENLTELKVDLGDTQFGETLLSPNGDSFFPHCYNTTVYFKLYIPFKVQEALGFPCSTEKFEVFIVHHYHYPVTYIPAEREGGIPPYDLSGRIALVREYLKSKFKSEVLNFFCVGPSPFHATFEADPSDEELSLTDLEKAPGYRRYRYPYDPQQSNHLYPFILKYGDTLSLFYALTTTRSRILSDEMAIAGGITSIVSPPADFRSKFRRFWTRSDDVDSVHSLIMSAEQRREYIRAELEQAAGARANSDFRDLEYHFAELQKLSLPKAYEKELQVLATYERRGLATVQNSAVLIAGLLGGILGAIGASLAG